MSSDLRGKVSNYLGLIMVAVQCLECEFIGENKLDMEEHSAKLHGDEFECELCDYKATDLDKLEIHLSMR